MTPTDHPERLRRARASLDGLSIGDAFGERFFVHPHRLTQLLDSRAVPASPWAYTDDTVMALSIVDVLAERGHIDQELLARLFGARYHADRGRGYGGTAHDILDRIAKGAPWREASSDVFAGAGSMGNGAAMRVAPIGAYFKDDLDATVENARLSAEVTHMHPEGQAGAIAIAVAAAWTARGGRDPADLFTTVLRLTPDSETRAGIEKAADLPLEYNIQTATSVLGNGSRIISQDTVPYTLWCAARHRDNYEEALWSTVSGLGDRDTTCAIVGGILASDPSVTIPAEWLGAREPLENMARGHLKAWGA